MINPEDSWTPQSGPQEAAIRTAGFVDELFFGGARGGGKSDFLLGDFASDVTQYGTAWRGILFRKNFPDLEEIEMRSKELFYGMFPGAEYRVGTKTWHFPGGAFLRLRHMESEVDADKYIGHQYTWIGFDELPTWSNLKHYHMMKACLRSAAKVTNKRIRSTGNPGGVGHQAVKKYFGIEGEGKKGHKVIVDDVSDMTRMFIPSRVTDNKILVTNDPGYEGRLRSQAHGDAQLVKAWLDGDWDAFVGQYFGMWDDKALHIEPFDIPVDWPIYGGLDYGEASPTSFGLYTRDFDDRLIRIAEYYQADATATEHARGVRELIDTCPFTQGRLPEAVFSDPSMWVTRRLSAAYSRAPADFVMDESLYLVRANIDRVSGWRVCKDLLYRENFYIFAGGWNENFSRTVPQLPRSHNNAEDLDTRAEDHCADEWRYVALHAWKPYEQPKKPEIVNFQGKGILEGLRGEFKASQYI